MINDLIQTAAKKYSLDSLFLNALISTESGFNTNAIRYEPNYKYVYKVEACAKLVGCTVDTMLVSQKTSWGLGQILAANYYQLGGTDWPGVLLRPEVNIDFVCKHIDNLIRTQKLTGVKEFYAAYNAGSVRYKSDGDLVNQGNVDRFMKIYIKVKTI